MSVRAWAATLLTTTTCALAAAGCGGGDGGASDGGAPRSGAELFRSNGCASCHTLAAVGATGSFGPDLDELRPDAAAVAHKVAVGGGGMPAFEDKLSRAELDRLAAWVAREAGR